MIDDKEEKKEQCETGFDTAEDATKRLARAIYDLEKANEENKSAVATLTSDKADLVQVAEAAEQWKAEHQNFVL